MPLELCSCTPDVQVVKLLLKLVHHCSDLRRKGWVSAGARSAARLKAPARHSWRPAPCPCPSPHPSCSWSAAAQRDAIRGEQAHGKEEQRARTVFMRTAVSTRDATCRGMHAQHSVVRLVLLRRSDSGGSHGRAEQRTPSIRDASRRKFSAWFFSRIAFFTHGARPVSACLKCAQSSRCTYRCIDAGALHVTLLDRLLAHRQRHQALPCVAHTPPASASASESSHSSRTSLSSWTSSWM